MRKLIYIGDKFYGESNSMMSPLYEEDTRKRYDWGFVQIDCREGRTVNIRPATEEEMKIAEQKLLDVKSRFGSAETQD